MNRPEMERYEESDGRGGNGVEEKQNGQTDVGIGNKQNRSEVW